MSVAQLITAAELAALQVPGYPTTKRSWNRLREREGWPISRRRGPCGVELWVVADLPEDIRAAVIAHRAAALAPIAPVPAMNDASRSRGRPRGTGHFDRHPDQAKAVLSWIAGHKHSAPNIQRLLVAEFGDQAPPLRTVHRYIAALEAKLPATLLRERDPDGYKSRYQVALGRADGGVTYAHEVWELDTTKADVMTQGGRRMVLAVIDRWSRRKRYLVAESESGLSVRRLLIETMLAWGVTPGTIVTDNGAGYINASVVTALQMLGIVHEPCLPGTPERKPFVERGFQDFMHHRAALLPGFTGKSVAEAQRLRARAKKRTGRAEILATLSADELQAELDLFVEGFYHRTRHSGIKMTPMERWLSSPIAPRAAPTEEQLRLALSALVGTRRIGKKGLEWRGASYWSPQLGAWMGRDVVVRRNEDNLGELLAFDPDGYFIGRACNAERFGWTEREFALAARDHQRVHEKEARQMVREAQRAFPIDRAIDQMRRAEAELAGKLVQFPTRTVPHETPQMASFTAEPPRLPSEAELARAEARYATGPAEPERSIPDKVARADAILAAAQAGAEVDPAELERARIYAGSVEYRTEKMLVADFGPKPTLIPFNRTEYHA